MPKFVAIGASAIMLFAANGVAQERGIELQGGVGYVRDSGEGPSVPAINAGVVAWLTRAWGMGVRLTEGLIDDRHDPLYATAEQFVRPGDLRMWAITSQWRGMTGGTELNFGLGAGGHGYRIKNRNATGFPRGSGFLAIDFLVGRHLTGPLHIKGGFTYGLAGDLHPFQPVVIFAFKP